MGLLADFFIAAPEQAAEYAARHAPQGLIAADDIVQSGDFTELDLGTLWAGLENRAWDQERHRLHAFDDGEGETWLVGFPAALTALLAGLGEPVNLGQISAELRCEPETLVQIVADLRRLAQRALAENKGLYLWGSL